VVLPGLGEFRDFGLCGSFFVKTGFISCERISLFLGTIAGTVITGATVTGDNLFCLGTFFEFFLDLLLGFYCLVESFSLSLRLLDCGSRFI
jgi:hypothetical protein